MLGEMSRRDFLKLGLATAAGLTAGGEGIAVAKKIVEKMAGIAREKKEIVAPPGGFIKNEIDLLTHSITDEDLKAKIGSECERIADMEAEKTLGKFNNNSVLMQRYFEPFLNRREEIFKALDEADPKKKVPREVALGIIGMESGGKDAKNQDSGAAGIYQLTKKTAQMLGLIVNEKVDERFDLRKASAAMIRYLLYLYENFGQQWGLTLMAYSGGPTKLENRLRKKFSLSGQAKLTPELFKGRVINAVTVYSKKFKHLGQHHSVQYPFGAQTMANLMRDLINKKI